MNVKNMNAKEFIKTVFNRYTSIGLSCMGVYNIALLFLYFRRWIVEMPDSMSLIAVDVSLVACPTLIGFVIEFFWMLRRKKGSRTGGSE